MPSVLLAFQVISLLCQVSTSESEASTDAPAGCRLIKSDKEWPSPQTREEALPGIIPHDKDPATAKLKGVFPDYRYRVRSISDVQNAVKFASKHNLRLSTIGTGHDFLNRNTAASGLLIDTSLLIGVRVRQTYEAITKGVEPLVRGDMGTVITPRQGTYAAVTFSPGIGTQALNDVLSKLKLFTHGAAHGLTDTSIPRNKGMFTQDGRLLSAARLASPNILDAYEAYEGSLKAWGFLMTAPQDRTGQGNDTSVHPGWRKAIVSASIGSTDGLRKFAPEMGVYQNEARYDEPDYIEAFWGSNYDRLSKIKAKYDPNMLFWITPGVNADRMQASNGRVCKVQASSQKSENSRVPPLNDAQNFANLTNQAELVSIIGNFELTGGRGSAGQIMLGANPGIEVLYVTIDDER